MSGFALFVCLFVFFYALVVVLLLMCDCYVCANRLMPWSSKPHRRRRSMQQQCRQRRLSLSHSCSNIAIVQRHKQ